jgi:chromosomal replication initiation ATPase DnaA
MPMTTDNRPMPDDDSCFSGAEIKKATCFIYKVSPNEFESPRRDKRIVAARHVFFWLAVKYTKFSLANIGRFCGNRNYSTVLHGRRKVDADIKSGGTLSGISKLIPEVEAMLAAIGE